MKFRIIASIVLVVVLVGIAAVTSDDGPTPKRDTASSSQPSADERAMKSLNLN